ncbi:MAG: sugar-binding protein [Anaerolineales bacterium]
MLKRNSILGLLLLSAAAVSCTLPGLASPTPFTFPTPNLTLTVIFAPTETPTAEVPTLPPLAGSPEPTATLAGPLVTVFVPTAPSGGIRPNGSPAYAPLRSSAPTIDGDLGEWATISYVADACTYGCSLWSGSTDMSGTYYLTWDASNLYLAVRVRDDAHVSIARGSRMYRGDIVEIQFDANLDTDFTQKTLSLDDTQLGLSPGNFGSLAPEAYRWYPKAYAGSAASVHVQADSTSDGYTLEASIPWTLLGATPSAGNRYGFALSLSDDDTAGTTLQQTLVSSVSTRKLLDPTTWGTLILQ